MDYTSTTTSMQHPHKVRANICGNDRWLDFKSETHKGFVTVQVLINDPLILFELRNVVEKLIQNYMEE